jgi:hypothetical protein
MLQDEESEVVPVIKKRCQPIDYDDDARKDKPGMETESKKPGATPSQEDMDVDQPEQPQQFNVRYLCVRNIFIMLCLFMHPSRLSEWKLYLCLSMFNRSDTGFIHIMKKFSFDGSNHFLSI